jgi:hypothetical protein
MIYDIFYVSKEKINEVEWQQFRGRFPSAQKIENIKTIDDVKKRAFTKFFWLVWDDVVISKDFNFDYRVDKWDEEYVHVFKNSCNGVESYIHGVALIPKKSNILKKEFDFKFYVNKKEIDIVASKFRYPIRQVDTYDEYIRIFNEESKSMFWCTRSDITITDTSVFDIYFDPLDGKYDYDRNINHVFKNKNFYDGLILMSKNKILTEKEFKFRFPIEKKEWNIVASEPNPFDIVFISFDEKDADENFSKLKERFPKAKRVHGVKGIHQAHIEAAKISDTEMFWVVDADAHILKKFNFEFEYIPHYNKNERDITFGTVHVWKSVNPVNGLVYGYGGVKLLPKKLTLEVDTATPDMTTSISKNFKLMPKISNSTMFNIDEFSTWRSAFRECVKLSSKTIDRLYDEETEERLMIWCSMGANQPFGEYSIGGAKAGKRYGELNIANKELLLKINDFDWLKDQFLKWQKEYNEQR